MRALLGEDEPFVQGMKKNQRGTQMRRDSNPVMEKMLGQILVERNVISPLRLQKALDRQKYS